MKWYKNIWLYIAALLAAVVIYGWYTGQQRTKQHISLQQQLNDSIRYYRAKDGTVHATKAVLQIPAKLYKHIADSIVQSVARSTKAKDLVQHSTIHTTTTSRDTVRLRDTIVIAGTDTAQGQIFTFNDGALSITGLLYHQQADINYSFALHLSHTTKWHRPGLFKKKQLIVDAYSLTPNTTITGMQTFVIQQPPKKFYETRLFSFALGVGAGIFISSR